MYSGTVRQSLRTILVALVAVSIVAIGVLIHTARATAQPTGHSCEVGESTPIVLSAMALHASVLHPLNPLAGPPGDFPFQTAQSADGLIRIHYYYQPASFGSDFLNMVQQALRNYIQPTLGYSITSQANIYIYNSRADFLAGAQPANPETTGAYSDITTSTIYMPADFDTFATISHEMTHITFHQHADVGHLQSDYDLYPVWLDEGLASSDQPEGTSDVVFLEELFQQSLANGYFLDIFRTFVWDYPTDVYTDDLSYAEARAFIKYLEASYGPARFHGFISDIKDGDFLFASEVNFGADLQTVESRWEVSLGLPALKHSAPTLPAVETPTAYYPGHLTGIATQTQPFAVSGGDGWLLTAALLAAGATGVVLLGFGAAALWARRERKRYYTRQTAIALALPPLVSGSLSSDAAGAAPPAESMASTTPDSAGDSRPGKPRSPVTRTELLALALVVPLALGIGMLWTRVDPAQSWQRDFLAGAAGALLIALGVGVLALRAWRAERMIVAHIVSLVVLVALAASAAYTGVQAGIAQGDAYESANAYALALQALTDAGASKTDLMRVQSEWADTAYAFGDYPAATLHYRAAIALVATSAKAGDDRMALVKLTNEWGAKLVGAHLYDQAVQVYASQIASPSCDKLCHATLADADGAAYLAWANNLIVTKHVDDALTRLRTLTQQLPGTKAAAVAQHVLDNNTKGLAAAWAVGKAGDTAAMNLLLKAYALQTSDPTQQALASETAEPMTGQIASNYLYKSVIHIYMLAFRNTQDAEAFISNYFQDSSLFKVATATDASGTFTVWLPAGYTYLAVWEAAPQNGMDEYIYWSNSTFHVQPFAPLTISAPLVY